MKKSSPIKEFSVTAFTVPTQTSPEADGTLEWSQTTLILVELRTDREVGWGFTYGSPAIVKLVETLARDCVVGRSPEELPGIWVNLVRAVRNEGKFGSPAMAIAALDIALWDLRAKRLHISLAEFLGVCRERVEVYGSGGFTSATESELADQMRAWGSLGVQRFKMKVGTHPDEDEARVRFVRELIGEDAELMVDANEAFTPVDALQMAQRFATLGVTWFEQPIDARDVRGMAELRQRLPVGMRLADGEYIYDASQTRQLLEARAADVVQLDVTRCKGITGFLQSANLCAAYGVPISTHCAPALHVALGCAVPQLLHLEYFFDHARIENLFFAGSPAVHRGRLAPDFARPGLGLEPNRSAMERYQR